MLDLYVTPHDIVLIIYGTYAFASAPKSPETIARAIQLLHQTTETRECFVASALGACCML